MHHLGSQAKQLLTFQMAFKKLQLASKDFHFAFDVLKRSFSISSYIMKDLIPVYTYIFIINRA